MTTSRDDLREHLVAAIEAAPELPRESREHLADVFLDQLNAEYDLVPHGTGTRPRTVGQPGSPWWRRHWVPIVCAIVFFVFVLPVMAEHHVWVAPAGQTVRINGLDFKPDGDAHIVLLAGAPLWRQGSYLVSSKASIWMGDIQLQGAQTIRRQIDRNVEQYPLATFHFNSARNFIPGFPLIGDITASFARKKPYQTLMLARLKLPEGIFPIAEAQSCSVLSLPLFAELTDAQLEFVAAAVREATSP